ncbi:uncharacterized protein LOC106458245 [Limulus polyphemus]|uniref:Uncharacterized protein LOC106458245 n=1 Tax=Limulus polyphemus TaxID=6850 RepID=A0ABM1B206_LIMPO|nr:uncharacterized protein LOC106458245 [Limulus polyphemus]
MDNLTVRLRQLECHFKWKLNDLVGNMTVININEKLTVWMKTAKSDIQELSLLLLGYIYMTGLNDGVYEVNLAKAEAYLSEVKTIVSQNIIERMPFYLFIALEAHRYHVLGQLQNCESRVKEAEALWEEIKDDPEQMACLLGARGFSLVQYGLQNYEEAVRSFDKALKLNPKEPLWHHLKGLCLARLRRYNKSEYPTKEEMESLKKAISLSKEDNVDYISTYALSLSSVWSSNKKDKLLKDEILRYLDKMKVCRKNNAYILLNCAKIYRYLHNNVEQKNCLLAANRITEEKNGHVLHQLGLYFWKSEKDFEKAKEYMKKSGIFYALVDYLVLKKTNHEINSEEYLSELSKLEKQGTFTKVEQALMLMWKEKELEKQGKEKELSRVREANNRLQKMKVQDVAQE